MGLDLIMKVYKAETDRSIRHHLHGTRPLPQPPLSDLLPPAYLSSLRRTEARVRFVQDPESNGPTEPELGGDESTRPGLRRRSTGPGQGRNRTAHPGEDENLDQGSEEWELSDLRYKAEQAVEKLSQAVGGQDGASDVELRQQLSQLNIPHNDPQTPSGRQALPSGNGLQRMTSPSNASGKILKSNLCSPYPPNLPLALLRLMESYIVGLARISTEKGGWSEAKRERGLSLVKSLNLHLGDAERLSSSK